MKTKTNTTLKGKLGEDKALDFLRNEGLELITRNYRSPQSELDLIMRDRDITVFVEVRARAKSSVMHPVETIDRRKQSHIIRTSQHYLQTTEKMKVGTIALMSSH